MSNFEFYTPNPIKRPTPHVRRKKMPKWKKFLLNYGFYIICALVLAVIVLGIVLLCRGCSQNKTTDVFSFNGTYYIDDYTAYEFDGKGKGAMRLGETTRYVFEYTVKDDRISFNFEDDRVKDAAYSFTASKDTITLIENGGTTTYTLTKK